MLIIPLHFGRYVALAGAGAALLCAAGCAARSGADEIAGMDAQTKTEVSAPRPDAPEQTAQPPLEPRTITVPGTTVMLQMIPVPAMDGVSFRLSAREIPWELYDFFLYGLDDPAALPDDPQDAGRQARADAVTRPSRPYISMDRGFGRTNYPAISMSRHGAETFCLWLSELTGERLRLPSAKEWQHACRLGGTAAEAIDDHAWTAQNSGWSTHPRGSLAADALGLFDMIGNAAEWVTITDDAGEVRGAVAGGSYLTPSSEAGCDCLEAQTPDWNASDPQFPKSIWWLADGGFIGFRVLMEEDLP